MQRPDPANPVYRCQFWIAHFTTDLILMHCMSKATEGPGHLTVAFPELGLAARMSSQMLSTSEETSFLELFGDLICSHFQKDLIAAFLGSG